MGTWERRPARTALLPIAALVAATGLTGAVPAQAAGECAFVSLTPETVDVGPATKQVRWKVGTDCGPPDEMNWWLTFRRPGETGAFGWNLVANHPQQPNSRYTYWPDGVQELTMPDNSYAGEHQVFFDGYRDLDGDDVLDPGEPTARGTTTVTFRRKTSFGSTFNASPEPRKRGQKLKIAGKLFLADWSADAYVPYADRKVRLQFRPTGKSWQNVAWVRTNAKGWARTTVTAKQTGTWRYVFPGDATAGKATSGADHVKVTK